MRLLTLENVTFGYDKNIVINDLSFEVHEGDYLYVVGENGAGKSTLIKGLLGLLTPMKGKVFLDSSLEQKQIGYLPQMSTSMGLFPASVYEVVLSGCLNSRGILPTYSNENKQLAEENLKKLRIEDLKHKSFLELSGGQQRRVLLARALCSMKKILILDEPISGLDPKASNEFYQIIKELNEKDNIAVVMVSHDIRSAIRYGKTILHLSPEGAFMGNIDEYKENIISNYFMMGDKNA